MAVERTCKALHGLKPALLMVVVQLSFAGVNVFYKLAANDGISLRVIVTYRLIFAAAVVVPLALVFERNSRPKLTWIVLFQAFLCGLFGGTLFQNLYIESIALTSATFASAMINLVPAITFILAVSFRLEKLSLGTIAGKAKVLGTLMGIGGAMLLTFYRGAEINVWSTDVDLLHHGQHQIGGHSAESPESENLLLGSILALGSCLSFASWLIIQTKMSERYPCHYSTAALMCVMGAIQSAVFALCMESDWSQWKLGWNIKLLTVSYSGIVGTGLAVTLIAWCVHMRGPLYVSIFYPLMLVSVAIMGSLVLDENLHLGTIFGSVLIVCGLYAVLWGKRKETKKQTQVASCSSPELEQSALTDIVITSPADHHLHNTIKITETQLPPASHHVIARSTTANSLKK
ncbi:hypothetical protein I3760_07G025900 [Carya illinoinensis]|uniref:WAT1-related protein At1g68170-like n=1 Tax=Carya illinoinensis TaxID=32201 RepID=UPI001BF19FF1|nr:WAT1-related protein At1g68170-like [Carya illinoinensis]KAG2695720.1 hypothetical protein I3760_07G025900 [Carya illinoinensis]